MIKALAAFFAIDLRFHCAYHLASGGVVERVNGTVKSRLTKVMDTTGLDWVQALSIVLMGLRGRTHRTIGLSPHKVVTGRPMRTTVAAAGSRLKLLEKEEEMVRYCAALSDTLKSVYSQVKAALPGPRDEPSHSLRPGDWILIKDFQWKKWHQPWWRGPFQILLVTPTAVRVTERLSWVHDSHCKLFKKASPENDDANREPPGGEKVKGE